LHIRVWLPLRLWHNGSSFTPTDDKVFREPHTVLGACINVRPIIYFLHQCPFGAKLEDIIYLKKQNLIPLYAHTPILNLMLPSCKPPRQSINRFCASNQMLVRTLAYPIASAQAPQNIKSKIKRRKRILTKHPPPPIQNIPRFLPPKHRIPTHIILLKIKIPQRHT
jgi:hypothetical protein